MLRLNKSSLTLIILAVMGFISVPAYAAFESISDSGTPVLTECAGIPATSEDDPPNDPPDCEVSSSPSPTTTLGNLGFFPGRSGFWQLIRQQKTGSSEQIPIVANGTTVGFYLDRVYKRYGADEYIMATYISLYEDTEWTEPTATNVPGITGTQYCNSEDEYFEINDIYRDLGDGIIDTSTIEVAFRESPSAGFGSESVLYVSGLTDQGVAYCIGSGAATDNGEQTCPSWAPTRDNTRINFRADVSPEDDDGTAPPNSMWYYVYFETDEGISDSGDTDTNSPAGTISFEEGGEEYQCRYRITDDAFIPVDI